MDITSIVRDHQDEGKRAMDEAEEATRDLKAKIGELETATSYINEMLSSLYGEKMAAEIKAKRLEKEITGDHLEKDADMGRILAHSFMESGDVFDYIDWFVMDEHPRMRCGSKHYNRAYKKLYEEKTRCRFFLYEDPTIISTPQWGKENAASDFAEKVLNTSHALSDEKHARFLERFQPLFDSCVPMLEAYLVGVPVDDILA